MIKKTDTENREKGTAKDKGGKDKKTTKNKYKKSRLWESDKTRQKNDKKMNTRDGCKRQQKMKE